MEPLDLVAYAASLPEAPELASLGRPHLAGYHGYRDLVLRWGGITRRGAKAFAVGRSVRGATLVGLELGDPRAGRLSVAMAGIHALEWIGVEVLLSLLERLVISPLRDRRILLFPLVNVDGYRRVEENVRAARRRWVRGNANGVDLNRNWPTHFRPRTLYGTLFPWVWGPGPHALSEPEVRGLVDAVEGALRGGGVRVERAVALHSAGNMILFPFGGAWRAPEAKGEHVAAAKTLRARFAERYTIRQSSRWVPGAFAYGMELDHLHAAYGATTLLVEVGRGGVKLGAPTSWLDPFRWFNPEDPAKVAAGLVDGLEEFLLG